MIKDHLRPEDFQDDKTAIEGNIQAEVETVLDKAVKQNRISKANAVWIKTKIQNRTDLDLVNDEAWL